MGTDFLTSYDYYSNRRDMELISTIVDALKKILEEDEIETYKNDVIEELNLDFLIDYVYENEFILEDNRNYGYTLHSLE